jgi:hypothetical protein
MQPDFTLIRKALSKDLMEILIRFSLIAFLVETTQAITGTGRDGGFLSTR